MPRINVWISDEAKAELERFKKERGLSSLDVAVDEYLKAGRRKPVEEKTERKYPMYD